MFYEHRKQNLNILYLMALVSFAPRMLVMFRTGRTWYEFQSHVQTQLQEIGMIFIAVNELAKRHTDEIHTAQQ